MFQAANSSHADGKQTYEVRETNLNNHRVHGIDCDLRTIKITLTLFFCHFAWCTEVSHVPSCAGAYANPRPQRLPPDSRSKPFLCCFTTFLEGNDAEEIRDLNQNLSERIENGNWTARLQHTLAARQPTPNCILAAIIFGFS